MKDVLLQDVEAGDFVLNLDTRNNGVSLGVFSGETTGKGRPKLYIHSTWGDKEVRKESTSNYYQIIKITEEQMRLRANDREAEVLLDVHQTFQG